MAADGQGSYSGKVAFVTGAGTGIGRAAALAFAREGASVVVADVSEQDNRETARMIEESGGRALAVGCDVTRTEDVKAALDKTVDAFGRLDVAFNNAGVEQETKAAAEITEEEWDWVLDTDLRGVFVCMKHEIPLMLAQGGGAIVNTSSGAGVKGFPGGRLRRRQTRRGRSQQIGGPRLRGVQHPHKRHLPRDHRHRDDAAVQRGHSRGTRGSDRAGADRPDGDARGDRRGRPVAVFGRGLLRLRARDGHRRRPNGVTMFVAARDAVAGQSCSRDFGLCRVLEVRGPRGSGWLLA
jgi:NAD(P)-dependent dehydrogenase (short-subunit alcohol dehydrogenase family)